ncbi:hypothetical protein [Dulcicalothrix desertica]|uniref:hypothetical protein n=1 Tax=Dulcicalothrix desertica TaxID=32056 RepID=UPI00164926BC|nr:hypothetical protein [Dulcicalothrix desertica]
MDGDWFGIPECSRDAVEVRLFHLPYFSYGRAGMPAPQEKDKYRYFGWLAEWLCS